MALDDEQRKWLELAVNERGRFTSEKSIKNKFDKYVRRREKAAQALSGIPQDKPIRAAIEKGLVDADILAKDGHFGAAYKELDGVKKIAKAYAGQQAGKISDDMIRTAGNVINTYLSDIQNLVDFSIRNMESGVAKVVASKPPEITSDMSVDAVVAARRGFVQQQALWDVEFDACVTHVERAIAKIESSNLAVHFKKVETDINALTTVGRGNDIAAQVARIKGLSDTAHGSEGRYWDRAWLDKFVENQRAAFEAAKLNASLGGDYKTAQGEERKDAQGKTVKDIEAQERVLLDAAIERMNAAKTTDLKLGTDTARAPVQPVAELAKFEPGDVLGDLFDGDDVPDVIDDAAIATASSKAAAAIKNFLDFAPADSEEVLDLILKTPKEMGAMLGGQLFQLESEDAWSPEQKRLIDAAVADMQASVLANCPNKMASDNSSIDIKGAKYDLTETLGEGGFGAARRYTDPETGKSIVVKSLKGASADPERLAQKRAAMAEEMRTHKRALNGDPTEPGADNIVPMEGAAVGADGSLHMVMEDAKGGDLSAVGQNLLVMTKSGLIPEEARNVLAHDMIAQLTKGLMALEKRGLVHNDIKPENLLLAEDGSVKIIDFGESRFLDDSGTTPSSSDEDEGFGVTGGYAAPEQYSDGRVTSKVDTYAIGGTLQKLASHTMASPNEPGRGDPPPKTALERMTRAVMEEDPDQRPSLDAVLASSYMEAVTEDHNPLDVADLKSAVAEYSAALAGAKVKLTGDEFVSNHPKSIRWDTGWMPFNEKLNKGNTDEIVVPVALINSVITNIEAALGSAKPDKIDGLKANLAYWQGKVGKVMKDAHDAGEAEYIALVKDKKNRVAVKFGKDKEKKDMSVKTALLRRAYLEEKIAKAQANFYARLASSDNVLPQSDIDKVNASLLVMQEKLDDITDEIKKHLTPNAKLVIAELKVQEVSAAFKPTHDPEGKKYEIEIPPDPTDEDIDIEDDDANEIAVILGEDGLPVPPPPPPTKADL